MSTKTQTVAMDEIPLPSSYGAAELKGIIRKFTVRGLIYTCALLVLFMVAYTTFKKIEESRAKDLTGAVVKTELSNLDENKAEIEDVLTGPPPELMNSGPAVRAGTPVPVPDAEVTADMQDFATVDVMSRASAEGGSGVDMGGFSSNIDFNAAPEQMKQVEIKEEEPDINEFVAVEKEPAVDLGKLQGLVTYPEIARRAGVEGKVVIRALIDKSGALKKLSVEHSENAMLNDAAKDAVKKYGRFEPAIQNGQAISCWVSIPIQFKLR